jgi:sigma-B regulation protein RsbU (phosphoserine phosphatase)
LVRTRAPRVIYALLFVYIAISLGYHLVGSVSLIVGYFDLRHQVQEPEFETNWYRPVVTSATGAAKQSGLAPGNIVESLNGVPYTGRAQMQADRWYALPGDNLDVGVRRSDGSRATFAIPLKGYSLQFHFGETVFAIVLQIVIPLVCLLAGYWVVFARPMDPNAWFILILLSYPQAYISVSTFNWWPGPWMVLRLAWHLALEIMAPAAILWFGLLFPERSRIDIRLPWLKWAVMILLMCSLGVALASDYGTWYNFQFLTVHVEAVDAIATSVVNWVTLLCVVLYWVAIFAKLRTASTSDGRRRLRVLCVGSGFGLGSALVMWGLLPRFGINPANIQWLGYLSAILMLVFPFTLAYVVLVQRALDVHILVRMGTRYLLARTTFFLVQLAAILLLVFRVVVPLLKSDQLYPTILLPVLLIAILWRLHFGGRSGVERMRERLDRRFFREAYNTENVLSELAVQARSIGDPGKLIQTVSSRVSEVLHVPRMAVLLRRGDTFQLQTAEGPGFDGPLFLAEQSLPVQHLVRTNAPAVLYRDQPEVWFEQAGRNEKHALNELHAEVLLPLAGRNRLMGVMVLGPKRSEEPYSPSDLQLLASIGVQAGLGLEVNDLAQSLAEEAARHQRVQREVEIAREVQQRLFPQIPEVAGMDLAGHCRPALGVGGDYYDVVPLDDGRLMIAIGDVSGKGIAAALLMASLRASLRGIVDTGSQDLARMVWKLNRLIHESSTANRYATLFFAIYDPGARELRYVNAGHNPPIVLRGPGGREEAIHLEACGPVVGLLKDVVYEEQSLQLMPGDLFIGYTDGISEAMTLADEEFGEERIQAAVAAVRERSSKEVLGAVFREADAFTAGAPQYDDMTLLVFAVSQCTKL